MKHMLRAIAATVTVLLAFTIVPAASAASGSSHELGEMVDYPLTFPVDGTHHYADWFWAARSHGIHHAQDIMADKMTPVVAAASGTIRLVNWTAKPSMNPARCCTVALRHDDGWESWYIHLNNDTPGTDDGEAWGIAPGIVPGVHVEAGQLIGWVGDSQLAENTNPHLHFELRDPSKTIVNPFLALNAAGGNWLGKGPADPLFDGYRLLEIGTRGVDVRRLQEVLTQLGYNPGPIDGITGEATIAAVTAFQADNGLNPDGLAGKATRASLKAHHNDEPVSGGTTTTTTAPPAGSDDTTAGAADAGGILREGSRGDAVKAMQQLLADRGYSPGLIDGIFGAATTKAVVLFQSRSGLRADGLVGPATMSALQTTGNDAPASGDTAAPGDDTETPASETVGILRKGSRGDAVKRIQQLLSDRGYSPGLIDGIFGPRTEIAVLSFQEAATLRVDGLVGPSTRKALGY